MNSGRVLIETLGEYEDRTVLAVDERPARWRSAARVLRPEVQRMIEPVWRRGESVEMAARRRSRDAEQVEIVCASPVFGPDGQVYAVQVRSAAVGSELPEPYSVVAFDYSSRRRSIHLADNPFGWNLSESRSHWTVPEAFRHVRRCDGSMELILQTLDPQERMRWAGDVTACVGGTPRRYHMALRNGTGTDLTRWRGLLHDVTEFLAPEPASVDTAALAALGRQRPGRSHLVLADVEKVRLIRWVTDPVPDIQWKGVVDDRDTPHPDDVARIFAEIGRAVRAQETGGRLTGIRLRRNGGGWTVADAVGTLVPTSDSPKLLLIELTVTGYSDEPDPTEP
ncbi:GAF domain-containing protein [Nocardia miyunensis]|uniref:GAF domain-containing protein n=1 Tax=Nocardia miyunensis TaxID=282684 RepID=UPI00083294B5|nr:GAF domain-containing protein [Nocardia miyunensis]